jgi:hypothetical protein
MMRDRMVNSSQITDYFSLEERGNHNAWAIRHLKPGVTPAAAASDLNTIANSLAKTSASRIVRPDDFADKCVAL